VDHTTLTIVVILVIVLALAGAYGTGIFSGPSTVAPGPRRWGFTPRGWDASSVIWLIGLIVVAVVILKLAGIL
jgi:hypothetical protein